MTSSACLLEQAVEGKLTDWVATVSGIATVAALWLAFYALKRGNQNSSAAWMLAFQELQRQGWERFLDVATAEIPNIPELKARHERRLEHQFADLMNVLEIGSAAYLSRSCVGSTKKILRDYLDGVLDILKHDPIAEKLFDKLIQSESTFENIAKFYFRRKRRWGVAGLILFFGRSFGSKNWRSK